MPCNQDYPDKDGEGKPRQTLVGSEAWLGRGEALDALGRHDEAVLAYERAVELFRSEITTQTGTSNGWRYWWMGDALQTIGRTDEAYAAFAKSKELGVSGMTSASFLRLKEDCK